MKEVLGNFDEILVLESLLSGRLQMVPFQNKEFFPSSPPISSIRTIESKNKTSTLPSSCNSFILKEEDTLRLATQCAKWGNDHQLVNGVCQESIGSIFLWGLWLISTTGLALRGSVMTRSMVTSPGMSGKSTSADALRQSSNSKGLINIILNFK